MVQNKLNTKYNKLLTRSVTSFFSICLIGALVYTNISTLKDNSANKKNEISSLVNSGIKESSPITTPTATTYIGWNIYTNNTYHYSFKYPPTWKINTTYSEVTNQTQPCKSSRVSLTTSGNYVFKFAYALNNCSTQSNSGSDVRTYKSVDVNKQLLTKGYLSDCTGTNVSTCNQYTNEITYSNYNQSHPTHVNTIFTLNGELSSITFAPEKGQVLLTDKTFDIEDEDLDNLVSSITF